MANRQDLYYCLCSESRYSTTQTRIHVACPGIHDIALVQPCSLAEVKNSSARLGSCANSSIDEALAQAAEAPRVELDPMLGESLLSKGVSRFGLHDYEAASELYLKSCQAHYYLKDVPKTVKSLGHLGLSLYKQAKYSEAESCLERAENLFTDSSTNSGRGTVLCTLGNVYYAQKKYKQALEAWKKSEAVYKAMNRSQDLMSACSNQGLACTKLNKHAKAAEAYQKCINLCITHDLKPELAEHWYHKGKALAANHQIEEAGAAYTESARLYRALGLMEYLAKPLCLQGRLEKRPDLLKQGISLYEETQQPLRQAEALQWLAEVYKAVATYSPALVAYTRSANIYTELGNIRKAAETYILIGNTLHSRTHWGEAVKAFTKAAEAFRTLGLISEQADAVFKTGKALADWKETAKAMKAFEESAALYASVDRYDKLVTAKYQLGVLLSTLHQSEDAVACFLDCIRLATRFRLFRMLHLIICRTIEICHIEQAVQITLEFADTLQYLTEANVKSLPRVQTVFQRVSQKLFSRQQVRLASTVLERGIHASPKIKSDRRSFLLLAEYYYHLHNYRDSIAIAHEGLTHFRNDRNLFFAKGLALNAMGKYMEAVTAFKRGKQCEGAAPLIEAFYFCIGSAYSGVGENAKAINAYKKAIAGDRIGYRWLARKKLGILYEHLGQWDQAVISFRQNFSDPRVNFSYNEAKDLCFRLGMALDQAGAVESARLAFANHAKVSVQNYAQLCDQTSHEFHSLDEIFSLSKSLF